MNQLGTLGTRLGLAISASILLVSLAFSGYRYTAEIELMTDQLHAHMGENVAALTACMSRIDEEALQDTLEDFLHAIETHIHEFGHHHAEPHLVLIVNAAGTVVASTDRRWLGRPLTGEIQPLFGQQQRTAADRFRTVLLEQSSFLYLSEPLGAGRRLLYLEPYTSVTRLVRGSLVRNLVFSLLLAAILAAAVNVLIRRLVIRRLELLANAMERVEREGLEVQVPEMGSDELGAVRDVYVQTLSDLRRSHLEIEDHARTLESQVADRTAQLLRAHRLAAVGELAAGLAHGLNNPLASVAASTEKLLDLLERGSQDLHSRLPEHLRRILRNTDRCKHIAQSLLTFARESPLAPRSIAAGPLLREAAVVLESEAETRAVTIRLDVPQDLPQVVADPEALTHVLVNLLSNALDASSSGDVVELSAARVGNEMLLAVTDHGPGIAPEHMEEVFRPFFTTKPAGHGTGLGLSICHGITQQLGGRIRVTSHLGQGSRFEVFLPLAERGQP